MPDPVVDVMVKGRGKTFVGLASGIGPVRGSRSLAGTTSRAKWTPLLRLKTLSTAASPWYECAVCERKSAKNPCGTSTYRDVERVKGIEPSYEAWEAAVLPLNYTRMQSSDSSGFQERFVRS